MVFWLAVIVGGLVAWTAVQIGFYATWNFFFHLLLSVYMALMLAPQFVTNVTAATAMSWGYAMTLLCIAAATLAIGYGICYVCLSGKFCVEFPKTFDTIIAGVVGFLSGFLVLSFLTFALCLTPLSQVSFCKTIGLDAAGQTANTAYMCWWCDWMRLLVGSERPRNSAEAVTALVTKATTPAAKAPAPPPPVRKPIAKRVAAIAKPQANAANANVPPPAVQTAAAPPPARPVPVVDPYRRPGEFWEEELVRRRVAVASAQDILAAIATPQVKIIEVADVCAADKLDPKQAAILRQWVFTGGVLWASNDVLDLFGINHSKLVWWGGGLDCTVAEAMKRSPILTNCQRVVLNSAGGKAHALAAGGALPLLVLEKDIPFESKAGTACWSLVPYGKGWISDVKPVDTMQCDGGHFWPNFCQFCLGRELVATTAATKPAENPVASTTPKGPLTGTWQASTGAKFHIDDDGRTVTIKWISGSPLRSLAGTLVRRDDDPATTFLAGTLDAVFSVDAPKRYAIDVTATASDAGSMRVRFADWPVWNNKGKYLGTRSGTDVWTHTGK